MSKQSLIFKAEQDLKHLLENNAKLLFTTHGFRFLGIISWDRMLPDESLGVRRRWIKGLVMENGAPLPPEKRIFTTSLHRKNPKTGHLEDIVAHEDDLVVVMERKSFDLSDDESNFQFMPNMHLMNRIQQMQDEIEEGRRRLLRMGEEKEQSLLDAEHFKRSAFASKEREKTQADSINRLTRENAMLMQKIGNLESSLSMVRARNLEYEAAVDEMTANAQEKGTIRGMSTDDMVKHAVQTKKALFNEMLDIEPPAEGNQGVYEELDVLREQNRILRETLEKTTGVKTAQQKPPAPAPAQTAE